MKNKGSRLLYLLFFLIALYPAGSLTAAVFGCVFELFSVPVYALCTAALSVLVLVFECRAGREVSSGMLSVLTALLAPLAAVNAVLSILSDVRIPVILGVLVQMCCSWLLTLRWGRPPALRVVALILASCLAMPILLLSPMLLLFGNIGSRTVVQTVESPGGEYYAELIDVDEGALGGDTLVEVHGKSALNALLFRVERKPWRVYTGPWGEADSLRLAWRDDHCLLVNDREYSVGRESFPRTEVLSWLRQLMSARRGGLPDLS